MFKKIIAEMTVEIKEVEDELSHVRDALFDLASRLIKSESKRVGVDPDRWLLFWDSYGGLCITEDFEHACSYHFTRILEMLNSLPDGAGYDGLILAITQTSPVEYFLGDDRYFFNISTGKALSKTVPTGGEENHG